MTRHHAAVAALATFIGVQAPVHGAGATAALRPSADGSGLERHHYTIAARVRPLVVFWLTRSDIGDAVVTRRHAPGEASYSLLIGSDPARAPLRINRWGYIEEEIRGAEAHLIGLMTESDEESIEQAEASVRKPVDGHHPFKVIESTVQGDRASSRVTSIAVPDDYTFRQLPTVLGLVLRESSEATSRAMRLPPGTKPGFLAALQDAMHSSSATAVRYVYHGRLYELRQAGIQKIANLQIGRTSYGSATAADFMVTSLHDGEQTHFTMTYGTSEQFAEVPLKVRYQPRWWLQVELTIDDGRDGSSPAQGANP